MTALFGWVPPQWLAGRSFSDPRLSLACAPVLLLCALSLSKRWARFTDRPIVFTVAYGLPFFLLTFQDSLGDSIQMIDIIGKRYYMSEPLATLIHYWVFRLLHDPLNVGAKFAIALSSRLAGLAYLWVIARQSLRLFPDLSPSRRLLYRLICYTPGITLLFYGYVENTPLALPAEALWVLATIEFLQTPSFGTIAKCAGALALATALHGRGAFLAPALVVGCMIPAAPLGIRIRRAAFGGLLYFGLLALLVAYILLFDASGVAGTAYGNALGGGNNRMFVPLADLADRYHWLAFLGPLLTAGGLLAPFGLLAVVAAPFKREPLLLWALVYVLCDAVFVFLWEFDFGPLLDWDLIFCGACPLILLAAVLITRSKIPAPVVLPFVLGSAVMSMAYASIVNSGPLVLNVTPTAGRPVAESVCTSPGLRRVYYSDSQLSEPLGPAETDIPNHFYEPGAPALPVSNQPFGGVFEGYVKIPAPGRYRFLIGGQGNLRLRVADQLLFERWTGLEWRITSERELRFTEAGWYPIRMEFFSGATTSAARLGIEIAGQVWRLLTADDFCHD